MLLIFWDIVKNCKLVVLGGWGMLFYLYQKSFYQYVGNFNACVDAKN